MDEPITIYDVRENYVYAQDDGLILESESRKLFQTMTSAQVYLQELLHARMQAKLQSIQQYPKANVNNANAIAAVAANRLDVGNSHPHIKTGDVFDSVSIFFIQELKVLY
jgi:hypothetical protein